MSRGVNPGPARKDGISSGSHFCIRDVSSGPQFVDGEPVRLAVADAIILGDTVRCITQHC